MPSGENQARSQAGSARTDGRSGSAWLTASRSPQLHSAEVADLPAVGHVAEDAEQHHRDQDRADPGDALLAAEERFPELTAKDGSDDAQQDRAEASDRVAARHQEPCDEADQRSDDDPREETHPAMMPRPSDGRESCETPAMLLSASATELARAIRSGATTSREVVAAHIARIRAVNPVIN